MSLFGRMVRRVPDAPPPPTEEERIIREEANEQRADDAFGQEKGGLWNPPDQLGMVKHYVEEPNVPKPLLKKFWQFMSRTLIYTFLTREDVYNKVGNALLIARINELQSKPPYEITHEDITDMDAVSFHAEMMALRAVGSSKYVINERTLGASQFAQRISSNTGEQGKGKSGLIKFLGF